LKKLNDEDANHIVKNLLGIMKINPLPSTPEEVLGLERYY
jgi:hypothetical protein